MIPTTQQLLTKQGTSRWRWAAVALFVAVTLFPLGWLAEVWPLFDQVTSFLFGSEAAHVVGHLILFALLGTAVLSLFPRLHHRPRLYLALMVGLGLGQEFLQLASFKHRFFSINEGVDLGVDLLAAGLVWLVWRSSKDENQDETRQIL